MLVTPQVLEISLLVFAFQLHSTVFQHLLQKHLRKCNIAKKPHPVNHFPSLHYCWFRMWQGRCMGILSAARTPALCSSVLLVFCAVCAGLLICVGILMLNVNLLGSGGRVYLVSWQCVMTWAISGEQPIKQSVLCLTCEHKADEVFSACDGRIIPEQQ